MRLAEAVASHERAERAWAEVETQVETLEGRLEELGDDLRRRLLALYRLGGGGYLRLAFAVDEESDALVALRQLRFLVRSDLRSVERFRSTREELRSRQQELLTRQREVEAWVDAEAERRQELAASRARQQELIARLERERGNLVDRASSLRRKESRLSRLVELLEGQGGPELGGAPITEFRGVLDWPVEGEVVTPFGPRRDPRYGTMVPNNGVEIVAPEGGEARAVYPGRVLYAAPFQGYGYTAIVRHAGGGLTLYAGLRELTVERDDVLALGDLVGAVGPRLYFEIRIDNQPEDPLLWLR